MDQSRSVFTWIRTILDLLQTVQTVEKPLGRPRNRMLRYASTAAKNILYKIPPQDRDIILRIQDLKDMIPKDKQARKMCIATEPILILPKEADIELVMSQGVEDMTIGTVDGEVTNDGPVHLTASQVAQGRPKQDPMTEVGSPGEAREAGVRGEEVEEELGITMSATVKSSRVITEEDRMVTKAAAARDTTGVTATPVQGDATKISFALVEEGRTVAHILLRKAKVRRQVWREGPASIIEEVVDRVVMIGNSSYFCPIATVLVGWPKIICSTNKINKLQVYEKWMGGFHVLSLH